MNTLEQVKAIVADKVGFPANMVMDDAWLGPRFPGFPLGRQFLDLDSLDRLEVAMTLEEHFHIDKIPDAQVDKEEMGTPAGIAAYVDHELIRNRVDAHQVANPVGGIPSESAWQPGDTLKTPAESDGEIPEATTAEYQRGFTAGYAKARPLDPHKVYFADGGDIDFPILITRDELLRRGLAEDLTGSVMDVVTKLGFPTEEEPMGTLPTHELVPILPGYSAGEVAAEVLPRNWVKFLRIEHVEPFPLIHFDHPADETPDWLIECISRPEGDEGAIYAREGVLFVRTAKGEEPVKPGAVIEHNMVEQIAIRPDLLEA